jgi:hypothetical protein
VIVSAPAPATLPVPAVSFATSLGSSGADAAKTNPFRNVFDSLTLSDDHEDGTGQQGGASVPKSAGKKELSEDQSSGTEEALVLPAPVVAQPNQSLPKPSLILVQSAHGALPENKEAPQEATTAQPSSGDQSDEKDPVTVRSQASSPTALLPHPSLPYSSLAYSASSDQVPTAILRKPNTAPAVARTPLGTQSAGEQESLHQAASSPTVRTVSGLTVSAPPKPPAAEALNVATAPQVPTALPAAAPPIRPFAVLRPSTNLDSQTIAPKPQTIPASAMTARTSTNVATEKQTSGRASVKTPAGNSDPIVSNVPVDSSDTAASTTLSNTAQPPTQPRLASGPAVSPQPTPLPIPVETPAPPPQPEAASTPSANATPQNSEREQVADSAVSSPTTPSTESTPEPAVAPAALVAPRSPLTPVPAAHEILERLSEPPSGPSALQHEASSAIPTPKAPLVPQAGNFAFALRMLGQESPSNQPSPAPSAALTESETPVTTTAAPVTQPSVPATQAQSSDSRPPAPDQTQASSDPGRETQPAAPETSRPAASAQSQFELLGTQQAPALTPHWNDAAIWQAPQIGSTPGTPEAAEPAHSNLPLAAQEAHLSAPELPKTSASSEILLHLTSNDQSSAAIRVADRAGSVNVSVHASDPVLRESLRANLGDLSNQLSTQGWKADVIKSAAVATPSGGQQDAHAGEQRGSGQQSSGGERQPQRDRRANGGQWQQELDQQISGGDAHSGGNE